MKKIAIIGAGMTAVACVRKLKHSGAHIDVFEKSRGAGGRMATRRMENGVTADHGAQYFTAKSDAFIETVAEWQANKLVAHWNVHDGRHCFVGTPAMNSPVKHEMQAATLHASAHVSHVERAGNQWQVTTTGGSAGLYDRVISTVPVRQVSSIFELAAPELISAIKPVAVAPCWALMLVFSQPIATEKTHWRGDDETISWIGRNTHKDGRDFSEDSWTVHATPAWSEQFLEANTAAVATKLYDAFKRLLVLKTLPEPITCTAHRWRFAQTTMPLGQPFLKDATQTLYIGGDWCIGARIENAFDSGNAIACDILENAKF